MEVLKREQRAIEMVCCTRFEISKLSKQLRNKKKKTVLWHNTTVLEQKVSDAYISQTPDTSFTRQK